MPETILDAYDRAGLAAERLQTLLAAVAELSDTDSSITLEQLHTLDCAPAVWDLVSKHDTAAGLLNLAIMQLAELGTALDALGDAVRITPPKNPANTRFCVSGGVQHEGKTLDTDRESRTLCRTGNEIPRAAAHPRRQTARAAALAAVPVRMHCKHAFSVCAVRLPVLRCAVRVLRGRIHPGTVGRSLAVRRGKPAHGHRAGRAAESLRHMEPAADTGSSRTGAAAAHRAAESGV